MQVGASSATESRHFSSGEADVSPPSTDDAPMEQRVVRHHEAPHSPGGQQACPSPAVKPWPFVPAQAASRSSWAATAVERDSARAHRRAWRAGALAGYRARCTGGAARRGRARLAAERRPACSARDRARRGCPSRMSRAAPTRSSPARPRPPRARPPPRGYASANQRSCSSREPPRCASVIATGRR